MVHSGKVMVEDVGCFLCYPLLRNINWSGAQTTYTEYRHPMKEYSKALRCTFFWERKNSCSSNSCNFCYLIWLKARWSENRAAQGFHFINSFISNFFGSNSKTCTCEVCAAWGRVSRGLTVLRKCRSWAWNLNFSL